MVAPLVPFAFRGVIWYQGEANAGRAASYRDLFAGLITGWRNAWAQAAAPASKQKETPPPAPLAPFPFLFVQLANWQAGNANATDWALLREAQTQTLAVPATGMAVAIDIGDTVDIHPRNKQEVGRRLALIARAKTYHIPCDWSGPVFASATPERGAMRVRFAHNEGGLLAHDRPVQSLEVAGADRKFHPAQGRIEGATLVVSAPEAPAPVAVRYAWKNAPEANLFNGAGLPAAPFRSDNW
jgi:sialate O-acetylesterase